MTVETYSLDLLFSAAGLMIGLAIIPAAITAGAVLAFKILNKVMPQ